MNELETAVYHARLRQQLGVTDIQHRDFTQQEPYFQHPIQTVIDHPYTTVSTAQQAYVYHALLCREPGSTSGEDQPPSQENRIRNIIEHPSGTLRTVYQAYVNALASQVAHNMDGTQLNAHRQLTGKSYRRDITQAYLDHISPITTSKLWFKYEPYTGITSDIGSE